MAQGNARGPQGSPDGGGAGDAARASATTRGTGRLTRARRLALLRAEAAHERREFAERLEWVADPLRNRLSRPVRRVNRWWRWVQTLKPYRVWIQFSYNDGNLRTAGMSYQSLFAVFAALWVAFSIAGIWLTSNPSLFTALVDIINDAVPGLISTNGEPGVITEPALRALSSAFGWTSIIAFLGLLWTAVAWLYYTRQAVRAMFRLGRDNRNYALQKVTDFGLAIVFGLVLLVSASVSVVTTDALAAFLGLFGVSSSSFWFYFFARVLGFAIAIALNFFTLSAMYRVLSRVVIPWRSLLVGSFLGAVALSGLSALSGLLIGGAVNNTLLATFAVFVGLLVWFNLVCRVILLAAAWIAVGMIDRGLDPRNRTPQQKAYDEAVAEYDARILLASAALQDATEKAEASRGFAKWFANRRVRDARERLDEERSAPRPQPPRKRSWWLSGPTDGKPATAGEAAASTRPGTSGKPGSAGKPGTSGKSAAAGKPRTDRGVGGGG